MFGRRCLEQNYRAVNRLPQHVSKRVRTHHGTRAGFGARCLQQNGYRLARVTLEFGAWSITLCADAHAVCPAA